MLAAGVVLPLAGNPGMACPLRSLTGIPCPLCGMSTSVQSTMRLDVDGAFAATPVGIATVVSAVALLLCRGTRSVVVPLWLIHLALALMWTWQLVRFSVI